MLLICGVGSSIRQQSVQRVGPWFRRLCKHRLNFELTPVFLQLNTLTFVTRFSVTLSCSSCVQSPDFGVENPIPPHPSAATATSTFVPSGTQTEERQETHSWHKKSVQGFLFALWGLWALLVITLSGRKGLGRPGSPRIWQPGAGLWHSLARAGVI